MKDSLTILLCMTLALDLSVFDAKKNDLFGAERQLEVELKSNNTSASGSKQKRLYGLFSIVTFPNKDCAGDNGYNGTCLSASECIGRGGQATGSCAQGFGTCCFISLTGCGGVISRNRTFFQNPGFPAAHTVSQETTCTYTFTKCSTNICQLRLDFETFDLSPLGFQDDDTIAGNTVPLVDVVCTRISNSADTITSDTATMTHADGGSEDVILCGKNSGYHVYLDMGADGIQTDTTKFEIILDSTNFGSSPRRWNIMATQIECSSLTRAPDGCLQYFYGETGAGTIEHFNYQETDMSKIGHLGGKYAICTRREKDMCVMGMSPPKFAADTFGWSVNGGIGVKQVRGGCNTIAARQGCGTDYVQIMQATIEQTGAGPFTFNSDTTACQAAITNRCLICDRFCGKKLGVIRGGQRGDMDHAVLYTRHSPFQINVNFNPQGHEQTNLNKGFKLNYFQVPC